MKKKMVCTVVLLVLFTMIVLTVISAYRGRTKITAASYTVETNFTESLRIVQLTDLHGHVFGEANDALVALVAEQEPDLILMTGDMLDRKDENADVVCALIEELVRIAPVYYGYGNHETAWMERTGESLTPALTEAGAVVLDASYQDITVNGQKLRLGGFHGYYRYTGMLKTTPEEADRQNAFYDAFEDTECYKILLCHIPTSWLDWGDIERLPVDLVLSGHYHGGQIRLPLVGGLYAPYVGLFPEYTEGFFRGAQAACILSTGLGASPGIPRIHNLPQIVVAELIPEKT